MTELPPNTHDPETGEPMDLSDLTVQINAMPMGAEHKVMTSRDWETLGLQASVYAEGADVDFNGPEAAPFKPEVEQALTAAQVFEEMKAEGIEEPTPEQMADRLGVPMEELAAVFLSGLAIFKQVADSIAGLGIDPGPDVKPNRAARRLAAGKGPKGMRHGMMRDGHVQAEIKRKKGLA